VSGESGESGEIGESTTSEPSVVLAVLQGNCILQLRLAKLEHEFGITASEILGIVTQS